MQRQSGSRLTINHSRVFFPATRLDEKVVLGLAIPAPGSNLHHKPVKGRTAWSPLDDRQSAFESEEAAYIEPKDDALTVGRLPVFDHEKVKMRSDFIRRRTREIWIR